MNFGAKGFYKTLMGLMTALLLLLVYAAPARAELYMSISGTVKDAGTGRGIGGVEVFAIDTNKLNMFYTITENNGVFVLKMIPEGTYGVDVSPTKDYILKSYLKKINVERGKNVVGVNFELPLGGTLTGIIYKSDGLTPLSNAEIFALTNKGPTMAMTDGSGKYTFSGLVPEVNSKLRVITYGNGMIARENININAGQTNNLNMSLSNIASGIKGVVYSNGSVGIPIGEAFVIVFNGQNFGMVKTDTNGNFIVNGLPEGVYTAVIFKIGYDKIIYEDIFILREEIKIMDIILEEKPLPVEFSYNCSIV